MLLDGAAPLGVFSGGSLIVGSAARTDLLGQERTEELARAQYRSLQRLARLGDDVALWPTHGAGSFCSAPPGAQRTSTIGTEKTHNALLKATDEDPFVQALINSLGSYPEYFDHLGELNRRGPRVLHTSSAHRVDLLTASMVEQLRGEGTTVVDVRPIADYGQAHVPGAISILLRDQFATWLGWLVPFGGPLIIVRNQDQDLAEIVWQSLKIGYERILGELAGGMAAWTADGRPVEGVRLLDAEQLAARRGDVEVLDVRQESEYAAGHIPGARHIELGAIAQQAGELPTRPTVVMCGHGERAMGAASVLAKAGRPDIAVLTGGPEDWAETTGDNLVRGWRA
ncbi:rhodanese-like domain-containing protein [Blastococcus brunescens]|uniref:Rhodanese-like domain-containing protein n=1 Tax=Blastococcus brunescens TaxID=1564165 RepID=A0ABZ1B7F6_9ACTN|nr:rhodanese-like domain-containing protein [Blastococcus sp. BMG 8361]WRL65611.1 rhodanese-like domain-containing protein [Blastococcus sp. BMG 8361]